MRKLIIAVMALAFVAALAPAMGTSLFNGEAPVYAHEGHTSCAGGAHVAFGVGSHDGSPPVVELGRFFGQIATAGVATGKFVVVGTNIIPVPPEDPDFGPPEHNAISNNVAFLHLFPGFLCDTGP